MTRIGADYLVVGAGASGLAFTDELVARGDATVVVADRREAPGGHWNVAYPFVRLHMPSANYGVGSMRLGSDRVVEEGPDAGLYECATGADVVDYFRRVLEERLLPTGRVRFLGGHVHSLRDGQHVLTSVRTGEEVTVDVSKRLVDAAYLQPSVPAESPPSYDVEDGVRHVSVNALAGAVGTAETYVVIGAGKTGVDACLWLLDSGVDAERIRWVRPRDAWFLDRSGFQPLDQVARLIAGIADELAALAAAESVDDLMLRLERCGRLRRVDPDVMPTMFRCASVTEHELTRLRRIRDVVRLGRVRRLTGAVMVLDDGEVHGGDGVLYVDCSANGLARAPAVPVFDGDRITLQQVRYCSPTFNSALIAYVEATRADDVQRNRLCPPNPLPSRPEDWIRGYAVTMQATARWLREPDLVEWLDANRLNPLGGLGSRREDPDLQAALAAYSANAGPGAEGISRLMAQLTS